MEKSPARWWDLPSAIFLFFIIIFSTSRLQSTDWTDGLDRVRNMALLGLFLGLALGQSKFQKRGVILLSIAYMLVFLIWQLLGMIDFLDEKIYLGYRLIVLANRLSLGLGESIAGRPVKDTLFFVTIFCIPYWAASIISGYQLIRYANALAAVLPSGILMFVIHLNHYTKHDYSWLFGLYIFVTIVLLGRQKYLRDRKNWHEKRVRVSAESGMDFNNAIMVSAAILILTAWMAPSALTYSTQAKSAWQTISKKIFSRNERLENIFAAAKQESIPSNDFYRNELDLGTEAIQSQAVAFLVYVPKTAVELPRLYWRGRVYDRYENGGWVTTDVKFSNYESKSGNFKLPDMKNRISMNFTFNTYIKGQTILYSAAQPLSVDHSAIIVYKKIPDADLMDIMVVQASRKLEAGEIYRATALIANPTIPELRTASSEYPAWVMDRYLQLPDNFSSRIRDLALSITVGKESQYDKAAAITNYLRTEIKYSPIISFPEKNVDPLEYFLLDIKQGFCNYYATAEVLMLRSIGIPARLAVGFAQGEANLQDGSYTVRERDAHSWPEVYFPNYGWIEYEPTGNQNSLNRPEERKAAPTPEQIGPSGKTPLYQEDSELPDLAVKPVKTFTRDQSLQISVTIGSFLLILLVFILKRRFAPNTQAAMILKDVVERNGWGTPAWLNRWVRWSSLTPIEKYFQSINNSLKWMGKPQPVHATPTERAETLMGLLPSAAPAIEILLREHQAALFSPRAGDASLSRRAAGTVLYNTLTVQIKSFIFGIQLEK